MLWAQGQISVPGRGCPGHGPTKPAPPHLVPEPPWKAPEPLRELSHGVGKDGDKALTK